MIKIAKKTIKMKFIYSLQSEWLKTKRSAASWLCLIGGLFIPTIYLIAFLYKHKTIEGIDGKGAWMIHFGSLMTNMQMFLLPMGVILASSLITQMEFKNNTWKQLHTTPQSLTTIFLSKFTVIALMTAKFFLFFNLGIIISGLIPSLIFNGRMPEETFPWKFFIEENTYVFMACLPIIAIQFLISLQFKNFLVAIGIGLVGLIGTLIGLGNWDQLYVSPYSYVLANAQNINFGMNLHGSSIIYFSFIMLISYVLYIKKKEKG